MGYGLELIRSCEATGALPRSRVYPAAFLRRPALVMRVSNLGGKTAVRIQNVLDSCELLSSGLNFMYNTSIW